MTRSKENDIESEARLLTDESFVSLMEAECKANPEPVDEIARQRIWNNIQSKLNDPVLNTANVTAPEKSGDATPPDQCNAISLRGRKSRYYYAVAAIVLVTAICLPLLMPHSVMDIERSKGTGNLVSADLSVFTLDRDGKLVRSVGRHKVGTTLLFKVYSAQQGIVKLLSSRNGILSENKNAYNIKPEKNGQLLSRNDQVYGYMIEPLDNILQFCVLTAKDANGLNAKLKNIRGAWERLPASSCAIINVIDSLE